MVALENVDNHVESIDENGKIEVEISESNDDIWRAFTIRATVKKLRRLKDVAAQNVAQYLICHSCQLSQCGGTTSTNLSTWKCQLHICYLDWSRFIIFNLNFFNLDQSRFMIFNCIFFNLNQSRFMIINCNFLNLEQSRFIIFNCNFSIWTSPDSKYSIVFFFFLDQSRFEISTCTFFNLD